MLDFFVFKAFPTQRRTPSENLNAIKLSECIYMLRREQNVYRKIK